MKKKLNQLRSSWMSRTLKASKTAAGVAGHLAGDSINRLVRLGKKKSELQTLAQEKIAAEVAESLGELKGLMMKAGQMASYMDFALPSQVRKSLAVLQDRTDAMAPEVVEEVFLEEFGKKPTELFQTWNPQPFAAASIGQVHKAQTREGHEVAVKVQYPGIQKIINNDLKSARVFDQIGGAIFRGQDRGVILQELKERFNEECDYELEAQNQTDFKEYFREDEKILVPSVFSELSTKRVLTSEFIGAKRFQDFQNSASQEEKNQAGETIFKATMTSIFLNQRFNCDPHPGNFLFKDEKVVFLDFGCVKKFESDFIQGWGKMAQVLLEGKRAQFKDHVIEMGFVPNEKTYDFNYHEEMVLELYEPWREDREYEFTPEFVERTWRKLFVDNPNKFKMNCPKDFVFINRLQWGMFCVLADLKAKANWHRMIYPLFYSV